MRIAVLGNPDNIHVRRWVRFLADRGHELMLIADPHAQTRLEGIETRTPRWNLLTNILAFRLTPRPHGNSLWKAVHYRPLIRRFRPDVVHGFEAYYNGLATAWAGPFPRILTPWGKDVHHDAKQSRIAHWIVRRALAGVDRITSNDPTLPEYLQRHYGVDPGRVRPFSWGVDLKVFRPGLNDAAHAWREKLEIAAGAPVVFSPRYFKPYWGAETIVEAIPEMVEAHPNLVVVICAFEEADGFRTAMKRKLESLGVADSVRWIERWLEPQDMAALFNLAETFISIPEGDLLAMTLLEGMACGCLPILADLPAYRSHAEDGRTAIVLGEGGSGALAEAVGRALDEHELRRTAAALNQKRIAADEDSSRNMAKIEEVYAEAIEVHERP